MKKLVFCIILGCFTLVFSCKQAGSKEVNSLNSTQVNAMVANKVDSVNYAMQSTIDSMQKAHQNEVRTMEMEVAAAKEGQKSVKGGSSKGSSSSSKGGNKGGSNANNSSSGKTKTDGKVDVRRSQSNTSNSPKKKIDVRRGGGGN